MDADNVTFPASDPEAKPSHLFCMGLEFIRVDIHEAALDEIDSLKEQEKWLRVSLREAEEKLSQRAHTCIHWAKRAIQAERDLAYHLWQRGLGPKPPLDKRD